jgi:exonuclease SbcD
MKSLKIVAGGDFHLGLRVDNFDQTPDIEAVLARLVNKAVELKDADHEVVIVLGGDIFDSNDPNESQIAALIRVLVLIDSHGIQTYVMIGNHEARANPERLSCLSFIKDAEGVFPTVRLIEDITTMDYGQSINGVVNLTFLPHISKATVEHKKLKASPQEYIDAKVDKILKKIEGKKCDHIIFSHLNVKGAHAGSEENLLKRSDVYLPHSVTEGCLSGIKPTIIQHHIHSRSQMDNIHIIGSPVFCSFNEHGEKGFAVITVGRDVGDNDGIEYFPSGATEFMELEVDMIGKTEPFFKIPEVLEAMKQLPRNQKFVLKVDVTINPENNTYDWNKIKTTIEKNFPLSIIKTIIPRIISKRLVRNAEQKIGLSPDASVQAFIKSNWKADKVKAKSIYKVAKEYL